MLEKSQPKQTITRILVIASRPQSKRESDKDILFGYTPKELRATLEGLESSQMKDAMKNALWARLDSKHAS